jgi:hypothetical protein
VPENRPFPRKLQTIETGVGERVSPLFAPISLTGVGERHHPVCRLRGLPLAFSLSCSQSRASSRNGSGTGLCNVIEHLIVWAGSTFVVVSAHLGMRSPSGESMDAQLPMILLIAFPGGCLGSHDEPPSLFSKHAASCVASLVSCPWYKHKVCQAVSDYV